MTTPTSISAVKSNNLSIIYYVRNNGALASLTAQKSDESPAHPPYGIANILVNNNTVHPAAPQIDAVSYTADGNREVRFIYLLLLECLPIPLLLTTYC